MNIIVVLLLILMNSLNNNKNNNGNYELFGVGNISNSQSSRYLGRSFFKRERENWPI